MVLIPRVFAAETIPLIEKIKDHIIEPLILLLMGLAFFLFLWGLVEFIRNSDSDEARETGRRHMIWGVIGLFIMISAFGIINVICDTFSLSC